MESLEEMDRWVEANGIDALRAGLEPDGVFNLQGKRFASAWLPRHAQTEQTRRQAEEVELNRRGVLAAEQAAR